MSSSSASRHTLVVIPTYNEAENVVMVLDRVLAAAPDVDVLVVDDRSPDGTGEIVGHYIDRYAGQHTGVHLLTGAGKQGLGTAYRSGFRWALDRHYDAVVQIDADLSHPPERIPALLAGLEQADIVVGSRYVAGGGVSNWKRSRRLVSWAGNTYVRRMLRLPVHDVTAGFKAYRREALLAVGALESTSDGYCFQIENTWRAVRRGLTIAEVPIVFVDRTHGQSKMSGAIALEAITRVLAWRWTELTTRTTAATAHADPTSRGHHVAA